MGGFSDPSINEEYKQELFDTIVEKISCCCKLMKDDSLTSSRKIYNDEVKIMNCLVAEYLDDDDIRNKLGLDKLCINFIPENPENYDESTNTYIGRVDIKIVSMNSFQHTKDYFIAECKRIDGNSDLNKKYIDEGIARFVKYPIKYISYNKKNIMLGFIVKNIDIKNNTVEIDKLQAISLGNLVKSNLLLLQQNNDEYHLYSSIYNIGRVSLELRHIFYNFFDIVKAKPKISKNHQRKSENKNMKNPLNILSWKVEVEQ